MPLLYITNGKAEGWESSIKTGRLFFMQYKVLSTVQLKAGAYPGGGGFGVASPPPPLKYKLIYKCSLFFGLNFILGGKLDAGRRADFFLVFPSFWGVNGRRKT